MTMPYTSKGKMGNYNYPDKSSKDWMHYNNPGKKPKKLKDDHRSKSSARRGTGKTDNTSMSY